MSTLSSTRCGGARGHKESQGQGWRGTTTLQQPGGSPCGRERRSMTSSQPRPFVLFSRPVDKHGMWLDAIRDSVLCTIFVLAYIVGTSHSRLKRRRQVSTAAKSQERSDIERERGGRVPRVFLRRVLLRRLEFSFRTGPGCGPWMMLGTGTRTGTGGGGMYWKCTFHGVPAEFRV